MKLFVWKPHFEPLCFQSLCWVEENFDFFLFCSLPLCVVLRYFYYFWYPFCCADSFIFVVCFFLKRKLFQINYNSVSCNICPQFWASLFELFFIRLPYIHYTLVLLLYFGIVALFFLCVLSLVLPYQFHTNKYFAFTIRLLRIYIFSSWLHKIHQIKQILVELFAKNPTHDCRRLTVAT